MKDIPTSSEKRSRKGICKALGALFSSVRFYILRLTLKSCSFCIHWPVEIKNSNEAPAGRNFFAAISLSTKLYDKKI